MNRENIAQLAEESGNRVFPAYNALEENNIEVFIATWRKVNEFDKMTFIISLRTGFLPLFPRFVGFIMEYDKRYNEAQ